MSAAKSNTASKARSQRKSATADHVKRKRELDRIAQRNCRERTKNRIDFLEGKVRSLEARDRNIQFSSLMETQEMLLKDNTELRAAMRKIVFIAESILNTPEINPGAKCQNYSSGPESAGSPEDAPIEVEQRSVSDRSQDIFLDIQQPSSPDAPDFAVTIGPNLEPADIHPPCEDLPLDDLPVDDICAENEFFDDDVLAMHEIPIPYSGEFNDTEIPLIPSVSNFDPVLTNWHNLSFDWNVPSIFGSNTSGVLPHDQMWLFCDDTFIRSVDMTRKKSVVENMPLDSAVPVQAILWGWHTIDAKTRNHPMWIALREVDEKVFGMWKSKPQRIALMYVCSLVMQYRADPKPENLEKVPTWLRPRPSQERLQHPFVIDFLIWPGLRDFLVFNHLIYTQTGEFSQRYTEDFHFNWPFPETLIFEFDSVSGQYCFSKLFKEYAFDLSNWTMDPRFFERYKELAHDIPVNMRSTVGPRVGWIEGSEVADVTMRNGTMTEIMT